MCLLITVALKAKSTYIGRDVSAFSVAPLTGQIANQFIEQMRVLSELKHFEETETG